MSLLVKIEENVPVLIITTHLTMEPADIFSPLAKNRALYNVIHNAIPFRVAGQSN